MKHFPRQYAVRTLCVVSMVCACVCAGTHAMAQAAEALPAPASNSPRTWEGELAPLGAAPFSPLQASTLAPDFPRPGTAQLPSPVAAARIFDSRAIWHGTAQSCIRAASAAADWQCVLARMRGTGAAPPAIAFAKCLAASGQPGWMTALRSFPDGPVALATAFYPLRANTNQGTLLINGTPALIDVDVYGLSASDRALPAYRAFARRHPGAQLFAPAAFLARRAMPGGGMRFVFGMALKACHACAAQGEARIAYDFNAAGALRRRGLVSVTSR